MNNALSVGLYKSGRDLGSVEERRLDEHWSLFQPRRQCFALYQLHHQVVGPNVVKRADVGVVQRRNARASLSKRALNCSCVILIATARPNRVSTARKTSPMPPSPSLPTT